jgi:hypothetical protein
MQARPGGARFWSGKPYSLEARPSTHVEGLIVAGYAVDMADKVNGKDVDEIVIERFS